MTPSATTPHGNWMNNSAGYQMLLVFLLSLNFGIVFFDRQALNVLMPFVQPDLALTQTQIGLIAGGLSFTWAIAAFFYGRLSDGLGKRKILLIMATIAFSLCSFLTGLADSFALLIGARLLMGAAEGGVMPISSRAPNRNRKLVARPVTNEHSEKAIVARISRILRLPRLSDSPPTKKAAIAQLKLIPPAIRPIWKSLSASSGFTNGISTLLACRSKNTMPKLRLSRKTSSIW